MAAVILIERNRWDRHLLTIELVRIGQYVVIARLHPSEHHFRSAGSITDRALDDLGRRMLSVFLAQGFQ